MADSQTTATKPKSRQRRFQFSLRTLLAVVTGLSVLFAAIAVRLQRIREQRAVVRQLQPVLFDVQYRFGDVVGLCFLAPLERKATDEDLARVPQLENLQWLNLASTNISDISLSHVAKLKRLRSLNLADTQITDDGLSHLSQLHELEYLNLTRTGITDEGLRHLRSLRKLNLLDLSQTQVTGAGIVHLKDLHNLQEVDLDETRITDPDLSVLRQMQRLKDINLCYNTKLSSEAVSKLKEALPHTKIWSRGLGETLTYHVTGILRDSRSGTPMGRKGIVAETGIRDQSSPFCLESIRTGGVETDSNGKFNAVFSTTGTDVDSSVAPVPAMIEIHIEFAPGKWRCREVPVEAGHRVIRGPRGASIDLGVIDVDYETCRKPRGS